MSQPAITDGSRKPKAHRAWVKNAIIVFLVILLILTFFSNTIMNYSLPEVAAQYPMSTTVTTKVRGSGTVEAAKSYDVKVSETRTVASVSVKVGDTIAAGDTLLTLDESDSEELQTARTNYNTLLLEYNKAKLTEASSTNADAEAIRQAQATVTAAEADLEAAKTYETNLAGYQAAEASALSTLNARKDDEAAAQAEVTRLETASSEETIKNSNADYLSAVNTYGEDSEEAQAIYTEQIAPKIASLTQQLTAAQNTLSSATAAVTEADTAYTAAQSATEAYTASYTGPATVDAAQETLTEAQNALASLEAAAADTAAEAEYNASVAALELDSKKAELDEAEEELKALEKKSAAAEIVSRYAGVVTAVNVAAGDTTTADDALITVDLTEQGYTMQVSVTRDQAKLLRAGMQADITNLWDTDIVMTLTGITTDSSNPNSGRMLNFNLTGEDVNVGDSISFSIGDKNASYDVVIPSSAVHTDSDGSFVYTVAVKSSPLGNRYTVKKTTVTVIASDDSQSAVTGELSTADFVITTSTTPLAVGDQVRIAE